MRPRKWSPKKPDLRTHTKRGLQLPCLLHTSYIRDCRSATLCRDASSALDSVLSKDSGLVLAVRLGPIINLRACLWVLIRPRHMATCWLSIRCVTSFLIFCLKTTPRPVRSNKTVESSLSCERAGCQFHFYCFGP